MPSLDEIRLRFKSDRYADITGVEIDSAEPFKSLCSLKLRPEHMNANNVPMGGVIFTLADFAFAVAANAYSGDTDTVSQHASITFLAPSHGSVLYAAAECVKSGRKTSLYEIRITDDNGKLIAHMTLNGFVVGA